MQTRGEIERTRKALAEVEKEISSTFKLQLQISNGTEASQLTAEHLDKLGKQKKILMNRLIDLEEMELKQKDAGDIQDDIKAKILEFKRGFPKAPAAVRRRLLQKVFGKLVYTSKGLEAFFIYEDGSEIVNKKFQEPEGKLLKFENRNQSKPLLSGAESDLTLSFQNSQVVGIGWGTWTRTME